MFPHFRFALLVPDSLHCGRDVIHTAPRVESSSRGREREAGSRGSEEEQRAARREAGERAREEAAEQEGRRPRQAARRAQQ